MPIEFRCGQCGKLLRTPDDTAGKMAKCPECAAVVPIPIPGASAPPDSGAGGGFTTPPPAGPPSGGPPGMGPAVNPYQSPYAPGGTVSYGVAPGGFAPTRIDLGDIFSRTWAIFTQQWGICLVALLVVMGLNIGLHVATTIVELVVRTATRSWELGFAMSLLSTVVTFCFSTWLGAGQAIFFLKVARGEQAAVNDLFSGGPYFTTVLPATILFMLTILVGFVLCIIPGVIFGLMFSQFLYLIVDRKVGVMDSLNLSKEVTDGNKLMLFAIQVVSGIGALLVVVFTCFLGIFAAAPFLAIMYAVIYLAMTGQPTADRR